MMMMLMMMMMMMMMIGDDDDDGDDDDNDDDDDEQEQMSEEDCIMDSCNRRKSNGAQTDGFPSATGCSSIRNKFLYKSSLKKKNGSQN